MDDTLIPCDICNVSVPFSEYEEHTRNCMPGGMGQVFTFNFSGLPIPNQEDSGDPEDDPDSSQEGSQEGEEVQPPQDAIAQLFSNFMGNQIEVIYNLTWKIQQALKAVQSTKQN